MTRTSRFITLKMLENHKKNVQTCVKKINIISKNCQRYLHKINVDKTKIYVVQI